METTMSDAQLAQAIKEANERTQELLQRQQALQQEKTKQAFLALTQQAKERSAAEAEEQAVLDQIERNRLERRLREAEEEKTKAAERQAAANAKAVQDAKQEAERQRRVQAEETLRRATESAFAQEQANKALEFELTHPRVKQPEPLPPTIADAGHPLAFIFAPNKVKPEDVIEEISSVEQSRRQAIKDRESERYNASVRSGVELKLTVDGNDYSNLREGWKRSFNGEMLSDSSAVHLLTRFHLPEITKVLLQVVAAHKQRPMSMQQAAGMVETLLSGDAQ